MKAGKRGTKGKDTQNRKKTFKKQTEAAKQKENTNKEKTHKQQDKQETQKTRTTHINNDKQKRNTGMEPAQGAAPRPRGLACTSTAPP